MKLHNVWVVEGGFGTPDGELAAFNLTVDPGGWTLNDAQEPTVERLWTWESIGGLEVIRGAGRTPDGRAATALDVVVNGWPVHLLVPTDDLSVETIFMLGAFAPVGHPLRVSWRVKRVAFLQRISASGHRFVGERLRAPPLFLHHLSATRRRSALVVAVVLAATVAGASIAGVATSAQAPSTTQGRSAIHHGGSVPSPSGPSSSNPAPTGSPTTTTPSTSAAPAVAAGHGTGALLAARSVSKTPAKPRGSSSTKPTPTTTKAPATSPANGSPTTTAAPGTSTTASTTTTTRPRRPRPTTTTTRAPAPTTTRAPRPTTTTTAPPPTTTAPPPTTTAPPTTTPPDTTTTPPTTTPPDTTTTA